MTIETFFDGHFFLGNHVGLDYNEPMFVRVLPIMSYLEKRHELKKVLDVRLNLGYNELIKNEEWFLVLGWFLIGGCDGILQQHHRNRWIGYYYGIVHVQW